MCWGAALGSSRKIYSLRVWLTYRGVEATLCVGSNLGPFLAHVLICMALLYPIACLSATL